MPPSSTLPKTIGIVLEVDAIALYSLPNGSSENVEKQHCKIYDPYNQTNSNISNFTTDVNVKDTIIWKVKVDKKSDKAGYSAYITRIRGINSYLLVDRDRRRYNGVVKGTVKRDFNQGAITSYFFYFDIFLNGVGKKDYIIDPKLKGTKTTAIITSG